MHKKVTVELEADDVDVYAMMELACEAIIAMGFHRDSVAETLDPHFAEYNLGITPTKYDFEGLDLPEEAEKYVPPFEGDPDECAFVARNKDDYTTVKYPSNPPFEGENPYHYVGTPPGETGLPGESVCSTEDKYPDAVAKSTYSQSNIPRELTKEECEDFCNNYGKEGDGLGDEHLADYTGEDRDVKE